MDLESEVIVVGSGPAGAMAAWALRHRKGSVRIVDAGMVPDVSPPEEGSLQDLRRRMDLTAFRIGAEFEGLRHLRAGQKPVSLKLRAPAAGFVTRGAEEWTPLRSDTFPAAISLAKGGLGNAWGAGVYRFHAQDLRGMPITPDALASHYDEVSRHIGISGSSTDDLAAEFGAEPHLQPSLALGRNARAILAAYERKKHATLALRGVRAGRARLAVLSEPRGGRQPYAYRGMEFLQPGDPARYNPAFTVDELQRTGAATYEPGWIVHRFEETAHGVHVHARRIATGEPGVFRARCLILAAGALNSARIVLASAGDCVTRLPLLDNPMTVLPVLRPAAVGLPAPERESGLAELNMTFAAEFFGRTYQASIYGSLAGAPVPAFAGRLPFTLPANLALLRSLLPAVSMAMVFHPTEPSSSCYVRLGEDGALHAEYPWQPDAALAQQVAAVFRALGCWAHSGLAQHAGPGEGIHYAGTLPMSERPERYQLETSGRLAGTRAVYVCDGSCFAHLPAKNLTFTIMANAHRIASALDRGGLH